MEIIHRALGLWKRRAKPRYALAPAGGGIIRGEFEGGGTAAPGGRPARRGRPLHLHVGGRAGAGGTPPLAPGTPAADI